MIYFDNSATTFVDPLVLETFDKVCMEYPGNANSIHSLGVKSRELEEYATDRISKLLGVSASEVIYTSGATESNNMVLKGVASRYRNRGNHIITSRLEHSSTLETLRYLESKGFVIDYVDVDSSGLIDLDNLRSLMSDKTILVAISYVDSELGIKQNIKDIRKIINDYPKCFFHVDATQAVGKVDISFSDMDFMSMSAHKIFGLKGIGLLVKKNSIVIDNLIHGGKSTTVYRSGTPALPLICSLMRALEIIIPKIDSNYDHVKMLNGMIMDNLRKYDNIHINSTVNSICYIINFSIMNIKPETFIHAMEEEGVFISTKSACSTNDLSGSVYSLYHDRDIATHSIRVSLSYKNTKDEVERFNEIFDRVISKLSLK